MIGHGAHVIGFRGVRTGPTHAGASDTEVGAGTAQHEETDLVVLALDDIPQLDDHRIRHGIAMFGLVEGDLENVAGLLDDQFVTHRFSPARPGPGTWLHS